VDYHRRTPVRRALHELGVLMIPAYSPEARGRSERNFGTWQGRLPQAAAASDPVLATPSPGTPGGRSFCGNIMSPSSTTVFRSPPNSGVTLLCAVGVVPRTLTGSGIFVAVEQLNRRRAYADCFQPELANRGLSD